MRPTSDDSRRPGSAAPFPSDRGIVAAYLATEPPEGREAWELTVCRHVARDLVLAIADLAVRSADVLGDELARLHHARLRDAAIAAAIDHYLPTVLPPAGVTPLRNPVAERVVQGLVHRQNERLAAHLVPLRVDLPSGTRDAIDAEVRRVALPAATAAGAARATLTDELRSCLVEATATEWMHRRAVAFELSVGRSPLAADRESRTPPVCRPLA